MALGGLFVFFVVVKIELNICYWKVLYILFYFQFIINFVKWKYEKMFIFVVGFGIFGIFCWLVV